MATDVVRMTGNVYWAKVYEPDTAYGSTKYVINFYPENDAEWKKFKDSGIQKEVKEDENGKFVRLQRDAFKMIKGAIVNFTGPVVLDAGGDVIVDYVSKASGKRIYSYDNNRKDDVQRRGKPILIGNGSKVEVSVAVYDTFKGKGSRLETVKVLDLIEYKSEGAPAPKLSKLVEQEITEDKPKEELKSKDNKAKAPW